MDTVLEIFRTNFYWTDFAVGVLAPTLAYWLYRTRRIDRFYWALFWIGFGLGLTWEAPMQVLNQLGPALAVHSYTRPPPAPFSVIIVMHSFWDGGLFLMGAGLARWLSGPAAFTRFRFLELAALVVWGQASELWVELTSTSGEAWAYIARPWNPALFHFHGQPITLLPQLIWLAAPVVFYFIALKIKKPEEFSRSRRGQ